MLLQISSALAASHERMKTSSPIGAPQSTIPWTFLGKPVSSSSTTSPDSGSRMSIALGFSHSGASFKASSVVPRTWNLDVFALRPTFSRRARRDSRAWFGPNILSGSPMIVISSWIARISTPNLASMPFRAGSIVATKARPVRALP